MRRSEIFDSFVKIAQEKGMISNDSSEAKKKLEQTGRADSLDISAIEALYGVKPNTPKGMEYKKNIIEDAHPNAVVVSPSYDKLNGLVENENERQNIMLHIVQKTPDGLLTQRKYAEQDLLVSLVRLGNYLDNQDQDELRVLADRCLEQVSQEPLKKNSEITKKAQIVEGIIGVGALLGAIYLKNHMRFINDGFEQNHEKLIAEIDDLINSNDNFEVGVKYKPEFIQEMETFKSQLEAFSNVVKEAIPVIDKYEEPRTVDQLIKDNGSAIGQAARQAYGKFRMAYENLIPVMKKVLTNFANEAYKARQIEEKGFFNKLIDAPQFLHGGRGLVADDFDDVRHALETYRISLTEIADTLRKAQTIEKESEQEIASAKKEAPPEGAPGQSPEDQLGVDNLNKDLTQHLNMMGG